MDDIDATGLEFPDVLGKLIRFRETAKRIVSLAEGETDPIALMATVACELYHSDERFDWVGFYRNVGSQTLKIGPYQGSHGCLTIPFSKGICGRCAATGEAQLVNNVLEDTMHIACSAETRSELVLPVFSHSSLLLAVLDIDSNLESAFDETDKLELVQLLRLVFSI